jgi:4-amino-4-deoxy-L-arabinose transferase-like glycosyltransferase
MIRNMPVRPYVALVLLALVLRLAMIAATPDFQPRLDAAHYDGLACGLVLDGAYELRVPAGRDAHTCGRSAAGENPATAFRPPGWPALLAAVYVTGEDHRWTKARLLQALIGTLTVALIGLLALQLLGDRRAALAATALAAVDTTLLAVTGSLLSEPLFVLLITAATLTAVEKRDSPFFLLGAGALLGAATLVRSNGFVLVPVLALLAPRKLRAGGLLAAGCLLVIAPWTVRNAVEMDAFVPVASYVGTGLSGTFNEQARTREDFPGAWVSPRHVFRDVHESDMTELVKQRELSRRAREYALDHPGYVFSAAARNALRILSLADLDWHRGNAEALSLPRWTGPFAAAGFWVLLLLAAIGVARRRAPLVLLLGPALFLASAVLLGGEMRYRAPLIPFLICFAAGTAGWRRAASATGRAGASGSAASSSP